MNTIHWKINDNLIQNMSDKRTSSVVFMSICYSVLTWQRARLQRRIDDTKSLQLKQYALSKKKEYVQKTQKHLKINSRIKDNLNTKKMLTPVVEQKLPNYPNIKKWSAYHVFLVKIYSKRRTSPKKLDISRYHFLEKVLAGRPLSSVDEGELDLQTVSLNSSPIPDGVSENSVQSFQSVMTWVDVKETDN